MPEQLLEQVEARLEGLADLPLAEQVDVFDQVHRVLQDALASLDEV